MSNIQLQMKCGAILTYSNVAGIFWTDLTWNMNKHVWPPKKKNTILIYLNLWLDIIIEKYTIIKIETSTRNQYDHRRNGREIM